MSFPFEPNRGLIIVPAEIWGPSGSAVLRLAVGTGATGTLVNVLRSVKSVAQLTFRFSDICAGCL